MPEGPAQRGAQVLGERQRLERLEGHPIARERERRRHRARPTERGMDRRRTGRAPETAARAGGLRAEASAWGDEWKVTIAKTFVRNFLDGEAFAAGAMSHGVWIGDFKATFLQVFAVIED